MIHKPYENGNDVDFLSFEDALKSSENSTEFDINNWLYVPPFYDEYRYILGQKGNNPLICIGINPSTASPLKLDPTVRNVSLVAKNNGYDGWIMFNIYPQRATIPEDMDSSINEFLLEQNKKAFNFILKTFSKNNKISIWAAWGTIINKRKYLYECLKELYEVSKDYDVDWISIGNISKEGHPHHPLYLKLSSQIDKFDIENYMKKYVL